MATYDVTDLTQSIKTYTDSGDSAQEALTRASVGWTGKNKLQYDLASLKQAQLGGTWNNNVFSQNGVTITYTDTDKTLTVDTNGSASTGAVYFILEVIDVGDLSTSNDAASKNENYILTDGENGRIGDSNCFMSTDSAHHMMIVVPSGKTVSNKKVYPMVRDVKDKDSTFEPYHESVEECKFDRAEQRVLGAKNLFPVAISNVKSLNNSGTWNNNVYTINNVTATFSVDNGGYVTAIDIDGTPNAFMQIQLKARADGNNFLVTGQKYTLNGCPGGGSNNTYRLTAFCTKNGAYYSYGDDIGNGISFDADNATFGSSIDLFANTTMNHKVFKPMIRLASDPDNTFASYAMTNKELTEVVDITSEFTFANDVTFNNSWSKILKNGKLISVCLRFTTPSTVTQDKVLVTIPNKYKPFFNYIGLGALNKVWSGEIIGLLTYLNSGSYILTGTDWTTSTEVLCNFSYLIP